MDILLVCMELQTLGILCPIMVMMPGHLLFHWMDGQARNAMRLYGRATKLAATGNISVSTFLLLLVPAYRASPILLLIWTEYLEAKTQLKMQESLNGKLSRRCN